VRKEFCSVEFSEQLLLVRQDQFIKLLIFSNMNTFRNKVSLIGRLGAQPEVVTFETGRTLARFTIATNERFKDKEGNWQDNTQWHIINAWGKIAERVKKALNKGQEIVLEGKLVHQSYETKTGEKRYGTIIEATEFLLLTPKQEPITNKQ
jgi:single-strand DNA-binding protein